MIVHKTIGVTKPVVAFIDESKDLKKCLSVLVIFEYGLFIVATVRDVINSAGVFYA